MCLPSVLVSALNGILAPVSQTAVAFFGIYYKLQTFVNMPTTGVVQGMRPIMSYNYGEGAYDRVKKAISFVTIACFSYTILSWGILRLFPEIFIRIFDGSGELVKDGIPALHIYFFGFCFMALQFTGQSVFVALGKAKKATFFSIFRKVIIVVPLTVILPMFGGMGVDGVFWAEPISNLIGGCASFFTMLITIMPELKTRSK